MEPFLRVHRSKDRKSILKVYENFKMHVRDINLVITLIILNFLICDRESQFGGDGTITYAQ